MTKWKIKRNALVQSLFGGFSCINLVVGARLEHGMDGTPAVLGGVVLALISGAVIATDPKERHHTNLLVWYALVLHLLMTGFAMWVSFHWIIVVLYFLELFLCVYIWRKK